MTTRDDLRLGLEEEVRLAVVMYGGVSLAIYMYGVAEELWRLVRATCPDGVYNVREPPAAVRTYDDESTEPAYRELARLGGGGAIRSRFVVDIVSGTSAGGINGICLATALANDTPLSGLKDVWVKEGDIGTLVNDPRSLEGLPPDGFDPDAPPRSLLNGRRMLFRLVDALTKMSRPAPSLDSPLVDELDLYVTATDLEGLELPIRLSNATARERRHANRYQFRFSRSERRNDFDEQSIAFVAYAARATSAFPFAFEPVKLETLPPFAKVGEWASFYPDYGPTINPLFESRAFSDGGILDNKPFTYATETLVRRRAPLPVRRKLIYIEPDPGAVDPAEAPEPKDWHALNTAQAALMGIPRAETIREDIQALVERNRAIERVRGAVTRAGDAAAEHARVCALLSEQSSGARAKLKLSDIVSDPDRRWGPSYATYHRLKVAATVDYLAGFVVRAAGLDPRSDHAWAVREIVDAWKARGYDEEPTAARASDNAFLIGFDVPFRLRRLAFVYQKLKELQSGDAALRARVLQGAGVDAPLAPELVDFARFREGLADAMAPLYAVEEKASAADGPVAKAIRAAGIGAPQLDAILELQGRQRWRAVQDAVEAGGGAIAEAARAVEKAIAGAVADSRATVNELLGPHFSTREAPATTDAAATLAHVLRFYYDGFEPYDLVLYPIQYATPLGETNPVDILRISPLDAHALDDVPPERRALKGQGLHHFAAFLDEDWRRHDMAIGRLHGADCLIRALAPEGTDTTELVLRAQDAILRDYAQERGVTPPPENPRRWFAETYEVRGEPSPEPTATVRRAAPVIGTIVEDVLKPGSAGATAWTTLRQILPDRPGGARAAFSVFWVLWRLKMFQLVIAAVLLIVLAGVALIAFTDGGLRIFGIVVLVAAVTLTTAAVVAAWKLASAIRRAVVARVKAFLATAR